MGRLQNAQCSLLYDTSSAIIDASIAQTSGRRFGHEYKDSGPANQLNDNRNSQANLPSERRSPKRADHILPKKNMKPTFDLKINFYIKND